MTHTLVAGGPRRPGPEPVELVEPNQAVTAYAGPGRRLLKFPRTAPRLGAEELLTRAQQGSADVDFDHRRDWPCSMTWRARTIAISALMIIAVAVGYAILHPTHTALPAAGAATTVTDTSQPATACVNTSSPNPKLTPTPGFDPLTASDAELQAQDFPPRPADPDQFAVWQNYAKMYLAGQVTECQDPAPGDIPPELSTMAHVKSLSPQPSHK